MGPLPIEAEIWPENLFSTKIILVRISVGISGSNIGLTFVMCDQGFTMTVAFTIMRKICEP